ncbi:MAG: pyridoxamine 5'-phosphate oxidase [Proteobacteria bacterium]|nr:MAG: pyridoxamine 5'-phosphate oxidase [Pseudomonadota bacterium]
MAKNKVAVIAKAMKDLDICMMSTNGPRGAVNTRPMSNNRDVRYDGESFFFSYTNTRKVRDIKRSASVSLSFTGKSGTYFIVNGKARLIKDKNTWEQHWDESLNQWFPKGIDTPGIVLIAVQASGIKYWMNYKEGDIELDR